MALVYVAVGDNHFFGQHLHDGDIVDVTSWPERALHTALKEGILRSADNQLDHSTDIIDGGSA